jgi:putative transposase
MYHFVWTPKYRKKVFEEPYREVLKKIIEKIGYDYNIEIVELDIPEDHIHIIPTPNVQTIKQLKMRRFCVLLYPAAAQSLLLV